MSAKASKKQKYGDPIIAQIDPNLLFSRRLATYGKMHLQKIPSTSTIRDQVICLHPEFFGELGIIIGFNYNQFQVMFTKPSFGKCDLNGLCHELWAGKFYERDLFNFQTWPQFIKKRVYTKNSAQNIGWDGSKEQINLVPKFKEKALREFADVQKLSQKYSFSGQFLEFIETAKKNQKVEKIEEQYQVVDNKKKQYALKYDKGKPTIEQQYVQKIVKDKKYIEKPIQPPMKSQVQVGEYQKQIIENKAEKKEESTVTKVHEEGEEDDGDDILN